LKKYGLETHDLGSAKELIEAVSPTFFKHKKGTRQQRISIKKLLF
jgi:hypothetical protein